MQTTRRIENHHIALMRTGVFDGFLRGLDRILRAMLVNRNADLLADNLQLLDGGGAIDIAADQQRLLAVLLEPVSPAWQTSSSYLRPASRRA